MNNRAPPCGLSSSATTPPCAWTSSATIARPRPLPPSSRAACVVETYEALEHTGAFLARNAGAVVIDRERHEPVTLVERERDRPRGVASSVVGNVAHDASERACITHDPAGGHRVGIDRQRCRVAQPASFREHEIVDVDGAGRQPQHFLVGKGQEQQIVDEMLDPQIIGEHVLGELARRDAPRMCECDLGILPYRCDR